MVAVPASSSASSGPLIYISPQMPYHQKIPWTCGAIAAASGGVVLLGDFIQKTESSQTKQILSCILVFWVVFMVRSTMTYVWGFGLAQNCGSPPTPTPTPAAVTEEEDDGAVDEKTPARRRTRTRRDN